MMTPVGRIALIRSFPRSGHAARVELRGDTALVAPLVGPFIGGFMVHWICRGAASSS